MLNTAPVPNVDTSSRNNYLQGLDDAWGRHLAPRSPDAPTVISTFAGGGGSSLGYSMAGYRELLAVEWDNNAVETFKLNFPDVPVYHGDIAGLSVDACLQMAGIKAEELDVFDGSPPCQGFSMAGHRMINDPRNQLFREYVRLLRGLQPKVFVMENVSGMVRGKMKLVFAEILQELKASGYQVKACLMNAMYFNVPQNRQRIIFIGVRNDLNQTPDFPAARHFPVSIQKAIEGVVNQTFAPLPDTLAILLPHIPPGEDVRAVPVAILREHYPVIFDKVQRHAFESRMRRPLLNQPHPTIPKTFIAYSAEAPLHSIENRYWTIEELKRLSSFPDHFRITGAFRNQFAILGNSVPPLFMYAIASHVRHQYL